MPVADEKLKEKIPFSVYTMMLIMGFLATCTAIYFLHQELHIYWYADELQGQKDDEGKPIEPPPHAVHLTEINEHYEAFPPPEMPSQLFFVTPRDLEEYSILRTKEKGQNVKPDKYKDYPGWFDWKNPIDIDKPIEDVNPIVDRIPEDQRDRMVEEYRDPELERASAPAPEGGAAPADGGAAPPADGGAAPAPAPAPAPDGGAAPPPAE